jgi:hypothetical protein
VLKLIPRADFEAAVHAHQAERHAKGFTCWGQLVAMLFCQLGSVNSLRDITNGLAASEGKLRHLGLPAAPKRSTLAYANAHRPSALFEDLFYRMLEIARSQAQQSGVRHKFRFKNKLLSIDATTIELCASVFDWAQFRRTKGHHQRQAARSHCYPPVGVRARHRPGLRPRLHRLRLVRAAEQAGSLLRHPSEDERRHHRSRRSTYAPAQGARPRSNHLHDPAGC